MKKSTTKSSRRSFIKKVALGSTLVGVKSEEVKAATDNFPPGSYLDHPQGSCFKGKRKIPGWLPDTTEVDDEYLFLEEAIYLTNDSPRKFHPFPAPNRFPISGSSDLPPGAAFQEPVRKDEATVDKPYSADRWNEFNTWILGAPFNKKPGKFSKANGEALIDPFDHLLDLLANAARKHNAALYWMRRLHIHENHKGKIAKCPDENPAGGEAALSDTTTPDEYRCLIRKAQSRWKTAVSDLKSILSGSYGPPTGAPSDYPIFKYILADFVRVNDYIVSMRIVAQDKPLVSVSTKDRANIFELGGSSSSHISISSAFSSS